MYGTGEILLTRTIKGLQSAGCKVKLVTAYADDKILATMADMNVDIQYAQKISKVENRSYYGLLQMERRLTSLVSPLIPKIDSDFTMLMDDYCYSLAAHHPNKIGYWCQGVPQVMAMSPHYEGPRARRTLGKLYGLYSLRRMGLVRKFKPILANSKFTSELLNFFTGAQSRVVYHPIDTDHYKPTCESNEKFLLATAQTNEALVKAIAKKLPVVKFGRERIDGCTNLGYVPEEKLLELYSTAYLTLFPQGLEPFGYMPIESMSCGTPVLTYNLFGPSETVVHEKTGWLAANDSDFVRKTMTLWEKDYDEKIRANCRTHVLENFSLHKIGIALVEAFKEEAQSAGG